MREDSSRRRMKLLPNPRGSMHTEAIRSVGEELTEEQKRRCLILDCVSKQI